MATDLETALLRAFVTAARAGSISRAATALRHSQPALSQQLRKLERAIGQPLLHRTASGVSLTPTGEALMPYAERILALSAQALELSKGTLDGHCGIGLLEDLATPALTDALARFGQIHPEVSLELVSLPGPAMREAFVSGRLQVALCDPAYMPEPPRWTAHLPLIWAKGPGTDVEADPLPLVLFSQPCRWRKPILQTLEQAGRKWRVVFESTSLAGVQAAVRAGLGVSAMFPAHLDADAAALDLPALPDVELGLVRRSGTEGDRLVDAIESLLRRLV